MSEEAKPRGRSQGGRRRTASRLAAVQALYELELAGASPDSVLIDHLRDRWTESPLDMGEGERVKPDGELFTNVVRGVIARQADLDSMIGAALAKGWTVARLEVVLRCILRAGAFELLARPDVPPRVVVAEYTGIAHDFFDGGEPSMANGVLDRLARTLRGAEMDPPGA